MEHSIKKRSLLGRILGVFVALLITSTVVTTTSGCLVCRDCGPKPHSIR